MGSVDQSSQSQNQSQSGTGSFTKNPWDQAQPALSGLLSNIQGQFPSYSPTPTETSAIGGLEDTAGAGSKFLPQMTDVTNNAFTGGPDRRQNYMNNYTVLNSELAPEIGGKYLDPSTNPFFKDTTNNIARDTEQRLRGLYAGSGRSAPGAGNYGYNAGKGIAEATAPIYASAYNTERGRQEQAMRDLYGAGNATDQAIAGQDQQILNNQEGAFGLAGQTANTAQDPYNKILAAEAYQRNIPLSTLASLVGLTTPIAGLGGSGTTATTGTGTGTTNTNPSLLQDLTSIGNLFKTGK